MPTASIIGAALNPATAKTHSLTIGGLDVLYEPGSFRYGVPRDTITLTEAGPGGISSLVFTIVDPSKLVTLAENDVVRFWNLTDNVPLFTGFVGSWTPRPAGPGRTIEVRCIGIEVVLDWMVIPFDTYLTGTYEHEDWHDLFQSLYYIADGVGVPLAVGASGSQGQCARATPIINVGYGGNNGTVIDVGGKTLRQALEMAVKLHQELTSLNPYIASLGETWNITVDFYGGLRMWGPHVGSPPYTPTDYRRTFTIVDALPTSNTAAADLQHTTDTAGVVRRVYVHGANAAGSGLFTDGTGLPGGTAVISDPDSFDQFRLAATATVYLNERATAARGQFALEQYDDPSTESSQIRPGTLVTITDSPIGLSGYEAIVSQIDKRFTPTREDWAVHYGGFPKSASRSLRRLTRATVS